MDTVWSWEHPTPHASPIEAFATARGTVWAAGRAGALLVSRDDGETWTVLRTGTSNDLRAILAHDGGVWVAGRGGTFLRSRDGVAFEPLPALVDGDIVAFAADGPDLWAIGEDGTLLRSRDGGETVAVVGDALEHGEATALLADDDTVLVASTIGLSRSTDGGATFQAVAAVAEPVQALAEDAGGAWIALGGVGVTWDNGLRCGSCMTHYGWSATLYRSEDRGRDWTSRTLLELSPAPEELEQFAPGAPAPWHETRWPPDDRALLVRPDATYAIVGHQLFTDDGSALQTSMAPGADHSRAPGTVLGWAPSGALLASDLGADRPTLLRSTDGGLGWTARGAAVAEDLLAITVAPGGRALAVGTDVVLARDDGAWRRLWTTDRRLYDVVAPDASHVIAVGDGGRILRSSDGGATFEAVESGVDLDLFAVWARGGAVVAAGAEGIVLRSDDRGATWSEGGRSGSKAYDLWAASADDLWVLTDLGVQRSADLGRTWREVTAPDGVSTALWGRGPGEVYAAGWDGVVQRTTDGGRTWTRLATGTDDDLVDVWGTRRGEILAVGEEGTLLRSTDRGETWRREPVPTDADLVALGGDARRAWLVVEGGGVLHRRR